MQGFINTNNTFLDVARPPSRDPPPGDRLPGARFARTDLKSGRASERGRATSRKIPVTSRRLRISKRITPLLHPLLRIIGVNNITPPTVKEEKPRVIWSPPVGRRMKD
eukprot:9503910-Pyramimonas_sp.AAC.1